MRLRWIREVALPGGAGQFLMLTSNSLRMCWENQALDPLVGMVLSSSAVVRPRPVSSR
jgi:hypothetical protein